MNQVCTTCMDKLYMSAMTYSNCQNCGEEITTGHLPGYQYCEECASKLQICQQCGKQLK